jgi:dTDP-4-dehydrorhamnose 3,5-epimerase
LFLSESGQVVWPWFFALGNKAGRGYAWKQIATLPVLIKSFCEPPRAMKTSCLSIEGIVLFEGPLFADARGTFFEAWRSDWQAKETRDIVWHQDNVSISPQTGTIRGLHWQVPPYAQAKLVRVIQGKILDVVVDIRQNSATFGQSLAIELSPACNQALFIPIGFAHGFCTLEPDTILLYKASATYHPASERALNWASADLNIAWPISTQEALISDKDRMAPNFKDLMREALF